MQLTRAMIIGTGGTGGIWGNMGTWGDTDEHKQVRPGSTVIVLN